MTYLYWLKGLVCFTLSEQEDFNQLLEYLYERDFVWTIKSDQTMAENGMILRENYEKETGYICEKIGPCSVLEALIAMSISCETELMYDGEQSNRTNEWFWDMISRLGLYYENDWDYNEEDVQIAIDRFLDRTYRSDGFGGPFCIDGFEGDMREMGLWYQMNAYIENRFWRE